MFVVSSLVFRGLFIVLLAAVSAWWCGLLLGLGTAAAGVVLGRAAARWTKRAAPSDRWIPDDEGSRDTIVFVGFLGWWILLRVLGAGVQSTEYDPEPAMTVVYALTWALWIAYLAFGVKSRDRAKLQPPVAEAETPPMDPGTEQSGRVPPRST